MSFLVKQCELDEIWGHNIIIFMRCEVVCPHPTRNDSKIALIKIDSLLGMILSWFPDVCGIGIGIVWNFYGYGYGLAQPSWSSSSGCDEGFLLCPAENSRTRLVHSLTSIIRTVIRSLQLILSVLSVYQLLVCFSTIADQSLEVSGFVRYVDVL